jgi:putative oxidoreductase
MNKYIKNITIGIIAFQFIVFGLNKFIGFVNPPPPTDPVALTFLGGMFGSYLAKFVGFFEIVGSILLVIPRTRFTGLLLLLPVMANIVVFHLAHDNPGNGIWIIVTVLFGVVCYSQRNNFQTLLTIQDY